MYQFILHDTYIYIWATFRVDIPTCVRMHISLHRKYIYEH